MINRYYNCYECHVFLLPYPVMSHDSFKYAAGQRCRNLLYECWCNVCKTCTKCWTDVFRIWIQKMESASVCTFYLFIDRTTFIMSQFTALQHPSRNCIIAEISINESNWILNRNGKWWSKTESIQEISGDTQLKRIPRWALMDYPVFNITSVMRGNVNKLYKTNQTRLKGCTHFHRSVRK